MWFTRKCCTNIISLCRVVCRWNYNTCNETNTSILEGVTGKSERNGTFKEYGKAEEMEHSKSMVSMTFLKQIEDTKLDKKEYISKT